MSRRLSADVVNRESNMRVLILGGSGLISTEATRALMELGHETFAMTRGTTPFRVAEAGGRTVQPVTGDRGNKEALKRLLDEVNPDAVIDFICYEPQPMHDLVASRNAKLKHIVFVSTVCALGGPLAEHPARSSTECRPVSDYGVKKKEIEEIVRDAHRSGIVAGTIFRPSSTDGPGAWLSGNMWGRDGALFALLKARRPVIVCAGGVLCHHGSTRDVGRAVAFSVGRPACFGKTYQAVGDECVTQTEWIRRTAGGIGAKDSNIVEIDAGWLCDRLSKWKGVGFLKTIWRYHGIFDTSELKRDIPEWRPELTIADNARLTWEWGMQMGKWAEAQARAMEVPPEPLCEAYARAKTQFLG